MSGWEEAVAEYAKKEDLEETQLKMIANSTHNSDPRFHVAVIILASMISSPLSGNTMDAQKIKTSIHLANEFLAEFHKDD